MKQLRKDLVIYSLLVIFSILFYFIIIPREIVLRNSWGGDVSFTSRTFPYLIFIIIGVASFIGVISTFVKMNKLSDEEKATFKKESFSNVIKEWLIPITFMLLVILYGYLFSTMGYIIATIIVPPLFLLIMKCRKWQYYLALYGFATIVYLVFKFVLRIPL
jgi:hypothetical protein